MFKKLRNKFLILNLVIITIMMIFAFTSIYLITYNNVRTEIVRELHKTSDFHRKNKEFIQKPHQEFNDDERLPITDNMMPPAEPSVSFYIITDNGGNILSTTSIFEMDDSFYTSATNVALASNDSVGKFKLNGYYWAYLIEPAFFGNRIVFVDITSQQSILRNLIFTFIIVAFVMLFFILLISVFFANKSIKPIKEAFDKQRQFIGDASHELKTPLAVIRTNVDVLLSNCEDSIQNQSKWLNYIKSETDRMTKLTDDLLYLTRVDHSNLEMIKSDFNLSETVENTILTMEAVIFENKISLDYHVEPNLTAYGNHEQIKQVIVILLDNAIKYVNRQGKIIITLKKQYHQTILSITNSGKGIADEHIDKIFDRFYRTDKSRTRANGSYGLGLAIAKTIIEQHGGKISVKSIPNQNTTFSFKLPSN